jgi:hypothetical protein
MEPLGEIIGSDSRVLEVECHALYQAPAFGSFVRAECVGSEMSQFAVVTRVATGPFDGNRVVQAHRLAPGELEQKKPHLTTLLRTTFQARIVGYGQGDARLSGTPPLPARLHCFVYQAAAEEIRSITTSPGFLRSLADTPDAPLEDLLVAAIGAAQEAWGHEAPVVMWGKYLARLLRSDYVTLEGVLQRVGRVPSSTHVSAQAESGNPTPGSAGPSAPVPPHPRWEKPIPLAGNGLSKDPFEEP